MVGIATASIPRLRINDSSRASRHQLLYTLPDKANHMKIPKAVGEMTRRLTPSLPLMLKAKTRNKVQQTKSNSPVILCMVDIQNGS